MKLSGAGLILLALLAAFRPAPLSGADLVRQEVPSRFAPAELIKRTVRPQLSAEGRFVILPEKATVLIIDEPARVQAAATALERLEIPPPHIQLSLGLETGGRPRAKAVPGGSRGAGPSGADYVPFPTGYLPPRVASTGGGRFVVLPAHPTGFRRRSVGQTMEVAPTVNPDGSVGVEVNAENVEFSGFISYGSPILTPGATAVLPLASGLQSASAFQPYLGGMVKMPIFDTTRISTSLSVQPEVDGNLVRVHFQPRLRLENEKDGAKQTEDVLLAPLASQVTIPAGKVVRLDGFAGAPPEFNQLFFAPKAGGEGLTRLVLKAEVRPGEVAEKP